MVRLLMMHTPGISGNLRFWVCLESADVLVRLLMMHTPGISGNLRLWVCLESVDLLVRLLMLYTPGISGNLRFWVRPEGSAAAATEAPQPSSCACSRADPVPVEVLRC